MKKALITFLGFAVLAVSYAQTSFTVRIENVSDGETLSTTEGKVPVPLAPGVWVVHSSGTPLFTEGELDFGLGLEALAEDGDPSLLIAALSGDMTHEHDDGMMADDSMASDDSMSDSDDAMSDDSMEDSSMASDDTMEDNSMADDSMADDSMSDDSMADSESDDSMEDSTMADDSMSDDSMEDSSMADDSMADDSMTDDAMMADGMMAAHYGVFNTPVGADSAGPLLPGGVYEFTFDAVAGDRLSFATMFVQSNDWFYAPAPEGVALFDDAGNPISGDIAVSLWDAGTEVNEEAGVGANQAPRQMGFDDGEAESSPVTLVGEVMLNGDVVKVTLSVNQ